MSDGLYRAERGEFLDTRNSAASLDEYEFTDASSLMPEARMVRKRVRTLKPSPENADLYSPIRTDDPEIVRLANSIRRLGVQELCVTEDNYIISGHRRHAALTVIGQEWVSCRVLPLRRSSMTPDQILTLLRDYNQQRHKNAAEQAREEIIDCDPAEAHRRLKNLRDKSVNALRHNGVQALKIEGKTKRHRISDDKAIHVQYVKKIIFEERGAYWPLTVRGVHYPLLNYDFIRGYYWPQMNRPGHGTRQSLKYVNDAGSYQATSDLLTRLRLNGEIPWEALTDGTRPLQQFHPFRDVRSFVRHETEGLYAGYWRDLLQTQPNHVEVVCEKNTIYHMVLSVTKKYQINTSSGRGFNSIDPWHELYQRYKASGKEKLIVIILSDYDPEGEQIPHVCGRTLRGDFRIDPLKLDIIKAGVTREQITEHSLAQMTFAKDSSSSFDWFVKRNDGDKAVWELEALDPADMLADLEAVIQGTIDVDLFNREAEIEQDEAVYLDRLRQRAAKMLQDLI